MRIKLTFDVEFPSNPKIQNNQLEQILKILEANKITATFFIEGRWAQANIEQVAQIHDLGHVLGNHTFHHCQCINLTPFGLYRELTKTDRILTSITGKRGPHPFRLPYGSGHKSLYVKLMLKMLGFKHTHWDIDSFDWRDDAAQIIRNLETQIIDFKGKEPVVLFHSWPKGTLAGLNYLIENVEVEEVQSVRIHKND